MAEIKPGTLGNLYAYKTYTRPTARRMYGEFSYRKKTIPKHHENIQRMLHVLAINGPQTTWGMAKVELANDTAKIRSREKQYRKFLVGRDDRGRHSMGVLETGLVVIDGKSRLKAPANIYRLSIHGILYCLDVLDLTNKEIDMMAEKYKDVIPWIFGKWEYLKNTIGNEVYRLRLLAKGLFLDNIQTTKISKIPVYEILTYLSTKYLDNFEHIEETDLAEQISCWYYTQLLISKNPQKKKSSLEYQQWYKLITKGDRDLKSWYQSFLDEVTDFYEKRFKIVKNLKKL
ncbi:hypothetical protein NKOR_02270 [Candidatus Nitrosopumilus koreensis AR1]|uniref:Uncharacterized protein n=1 Tax=Candidatus Nitrosopumilus koreensis AR1 TaxID=1229908 RepID=K0B4J4_9ARCH|nr:MULTISPECIES: hypothetical protein [Nitrosopumilus]AFS80354.1 hypothetical protein NKOR_02270 [Candidatus Nitrosopumilus koreensis AR1]